MKSKMFPDNNAAATKLFRDVGSNNVKYYTVDDYLNLSEVPVHPNALTDKWSRVTVAASGDSTMGRDWLVIAPYRVDVAKDSSAKLHDLDPVLFVLSSDTGVPHPSGGVAYHQNFADRTTAIPGYESKPFGQTVQDLRSRLTTGCQPLEQAPSEVLNALQHMVTKYGGTLV